MHWPDWLVSDAWLTFGRIRPAHLNMVIYGWSSLAGVGIALWLLPRLLRTELVGGRYAVAGAVVWNLGVASGIAANAPDVHFGVEQATMNWWFGHNVLGLWFTPLTVGMLYEESPQRFCNAYLWDDQAVTGRGLVVASLGVALLWVRMESKKHDLEIRSPQ
jgi:cbb3-type cytochrome oxidase subunit 1